jgi:acyl dehydratase
MEPLPSLDALSPGMEFDLGGFALPREEVVGFAARFDPQPFHLDEEAGRASIFGGLVASGLHTLSATFGHLVNSGLLSAINLGGNAMEVRWPAPLAPEEQVMLRIVVESVTPSRSRPEMGVAKLRYLLTRSRDGVLVLDVLCTHFMKR